MAWEIENMEDVETLEIALKHPRGAIKSARVQAWLEEYVSGIDPLDAFRFYRESVGPF